MRWKSRAISGNIPNCSTSESTNSSHKTECSSAIPSRRHFVSTSPFASKAAQSKHVQRRAGPAGIALAAAHRPHRASRRASSATLAQKAECADASRAAQSPRCTRSQETKAGSSYPPRLWVSPPSESAPPTPRSSAVPIFGRTTSPSRRCRSSVPPAEPEDAALQRQCMQRVPPRMTSVASVFGSRSRRVSQNRKNASAPTCSPATTSTWNTPVFWKSTDSARSMNARSPKKHGAQNSGHLRRSREQSVQLVAQFAAPPRHARFQRSRGRPDFLKEHAGAKSCLHVDVLLRQEFAPVERTRILIYKRQTRHREHRDLVSGVKLRQSRVPPPSA